VVAVRCLYGRHKYICTSRSSGGYSIATLFAGLLLFTSEMSTVTRPAETRDGTVTSWIPMTTTFSAPPECGTNFIFDIGSGAVSSFMGYLPLGIDVKGSR
jgi:hypothetical protein